MTDPAMISPEKIAEMLAAAAAATQGRRAYVFDEDRARSRWTSPGFRKAPPQRTASSPIIRKADRPEQTNRGK